MEPSIAAARLRLRRKHRRGRGHPGASARKGAPRELGIAAVGGINLGEIERAQPLVAQGRARPARGDKFGGDARPAPPAAGISARA